MEYKSLSMSVKAIEDRTVTGIAAVTGNIDAGSWGVRDRIFKGAFKRTINARKDRVRHLWMHDAWQPPIASIKELREVGREELPDEVLKKAPEATGGLQVAREYLHTPRGDEVLEGIKSGAINEMSFGYDPVKWDIEELTEGESKGDQIRNLREVRLWDTSDVNWGMNEATVASKAFAPFLEAYKDRLEAGRFDTLARLAKLFESATTPSTLLAMSKDGRVLSSEWLEMLSNALATLEKILLAPDSLEEEEKTRALTAQVLTRLAIAEREAITFERLHV